MKVLILLSLLGTTANSAEGEKLYLCNCKDRGQAVGQYSGFASTPEKAAKMAKTECETDKDRLGDDNKADCICTDCQRP